MVLRTNIFQTHKLAIPKSTYLTIMFLSPFDRKTNDPSQRSNWHQNFLCLITIVIKSTEKTMCLLIKLAVLVGMRSVNGISNKQFETLCNGITDEGDYEYTYDYTFPQTAIFHRSRCYVIEAGSSVDWSDLSHLHNRYPDIQGRAYNNM